MKLKLNLVASVILATVLLPQVAAKPVEFNAQSRSLGEVIADLSSRSGAEIVVAPGLGGDRINNLATSENGWGAAIQSLLADYNYEAQWAPNGSIQRVIVSGRGGNGAAPAAASTSAAAALGDLVNYQPLPLVLPDKYHTLAAGSVMSIQISREGLLGMQLGDRIGLTLPNGHYEVVHDNRFEHDNGDVTWVGYLEDAGKAYRVILTTSSEGTLGQVVTPGGVYNLEIQDGQTWLVDLNASGLQVSSLENDDSDPSSMSGTFDYAAKKRLPKVKGMTVAKFKKSVTTATKVTIPPVQTPVPAAPATPVVDLLVLYTQGVKGAPNIATRINNLVAKANQAYIDSQINLKLRVVYSSQIAYTETNSNDTALSDLTNGRAAFGQIASLRTQYGADLVTLLRPFNYQTQMSCGVAWVNGANGTSMSARFGFSVVSDGIDAASSYYCSDFSLAHELGHNMGSAHDQAHSNVSGRFAYSYGYGANGQFGTIMSYYNPAIGFFSSPSLSFNEQPIGNASANNASSINQTAATVAGFLPTVVK